MIKKTKLITVITGLVIIVCVFSFYFIINKVISPVAEISGEDFVKLHSNSDEDTNKFLILGKVPVSSPSKDLSEDLQPFPGRWEGYNYNPPVKMDMKIILSIKKINDRGGEAVIYYGYNLQYPAGIEKIRFKVVKGESPSIEAAFWTGQFTVIPGLLKLRYNKTKDRLIGEMSYGNFRGPDKIELGRNKSFYVYKDYQAYLAGKRIYTRNYKNTELNNYGKGYMIYLPEGYEEKTNEKWPLILFLHGTGDRGTNVFLLAKASPYMMIREKGPLSFIIVAPILNLSKDFRSFPKRYLEGVLDEVMGNYRVDEKRVYLTGISMGGEATYRFALEHPEKFAAIASLSGFQAKYDSAYYREEAEMKDIPLSRLKQIPGWEIHGSDDIIVPVNKAQNTINDFNNSGVNIRFTILKDHDHDVWTDTYMDPEFYNWLLQNKKP